MAKIAKPDTVLEHIVVLWDFTVNRLIRVLIFLQ
jgi:hypothetical protein